MGPLVAKDMQDRHSLGCHPKPAGTELDSIVSSTGHLIPYCKFLQQSTVYSGLWFLTLEKSQQDAAGSKGQRNCYQVYGSQKYCVKA